MWSELQYMLPHQSGVLPPGPHVKIAEFPQEKRVGPSSSFDSV